MSTRKVVGRSAKGHRGRYYSKKMKKFVEWESTYERNWILIVEYCYWVSIYREQPEKIKFWIGDVQVTYFPDFELILEDGQVVYVEVKPKEKLNDPILSQRLKNIEEYLKVRGIRFIVVTEDEIHNTVLLANLRQLDYHNRWSHDDDELVSAADSLSILPATTIDGAKAVVGDERYVYGLLASGLYSCDLKMPLHGATEIWKSNKENRYETFHI